MSLDLEQDERLLQTESRLERVGWILLTVFIVVGLVGLLGPGPLSSREVSSGDGLVIVEYDALLHHEADTSLSLIFGAEAIEDGVITATLVGDWVAAIDVQGISPEPVEQRAIPGGIVLDIAAEGDGRTEVVLSYRAQAYGQLAAEVRVGEQTVGFSQFILP